MLEKTGVASKKDIDKMLPSKERMEEGPVVIVECFRPIPCDPCYYSCPFSVFAPFDDINDLPQTDFDKCTGCGICVAHCPGLALFVVDYSYGEELGLLKLPYEFTPRPEEGEEVILMNRKGEEIGEGLVKKVEEKEEFDKTAVITLEVPRNLLMDARHFRIKE